MLSDLAIAGKIKKYRLMKGYSQAKLGSEIGVAASAVGAYETGARVPKIELREKIANTLEVDPVDLSGLSLSEIDERRLLNKLLLKYCITMDECGYYEEGEFHVEAIGISVTLPNSFLPLQEKFTEYKDEVKQINERIKLDSIIYEDEESIKHRGSLENPKKQDAYNELMYWIETWPEYDYQYQEMYNKPNVGKRHSIKEWLNARFLTNYVDFVNKLSEK